MAADEMPGTYPWRVFAQDFASEISQWNDRLNGREAWGVILHAYDEFSRATAGVRFAVARHRFQQYEIKWNNRNKE
jgi:hypothetical protein